MPTLPLLLLSSLLQGDGIPASALGAVLKLSPARVALTPVREQATHVSPSVGFPDWLRAAPFAETGFILEIVVDVVVAEELNARFKGKVVAVENIPPDMKIADIGPQTVENFVSELRHSRTVFWNGPVGVEEIPQFARGTEALARVLTELKATTIIGGGSTAEVINALGLADRVSFVSTGGGASLKFLGGEELPGVVALRDKGTL